jgi:ferric-dicitrate binding protein FerR (iron transport regulator)
MRRYWWAVAAVVAVLAAGGWYFGSRSRTAPLAGVPVVNKPDAAPGGNKAVLTLADGHTIVLDSAVKGDLTSQGNTKVIKLDSGLLAYRSGGTVTGKAAPAGAPVYNILTTPRGGQYQIVLPDGSKVWLNAASSLKFPTSFTGTDRTVTLNGEAYFEVSRRTDQPFFVRLKNDVAVEVLGTRFNINDYNDEPAVRATLLEGSIRVQRDGHSNVLRPGQQAVLGRTDAAITINKDADLDEAVAWKNGMFVFNSVPLEAIMRQMERWYDVEVSYRGNVKGISFNGQISRYSNVSKMLDMLATTGEVHFIMENKKIIVNP